MPSPSANTQVSRQPHRWAVALACATFPLLWVGGLVTTTNAGMAVPDWPNTYGYNLFLYPLSTWLAGPWGIFIEHGHRLFASAVGLLTIGLLVSLHRHDDRIWMRRLGIVALVLVVFQGALGGMRVLFDERTLAMIHGCTGPLFFAFATALAVFTSRRWRQDETTMAGRFAGHVRRLAVVTCVIIYLQIVLGSVLRHVPVIAEPSTFTLAVKFHLTMAGIVVVHVLALLWSVTRHFRRVWPLAGFAWMLGGLMAVQLALGASTWIVKYAVPAWAEKLVPFNRAAIVDGGSLQTHVVTAHVAIGSLMLATSAALALNALRQLTAAPFAGRDAQTSHWEAAV